MRKKTEPNKDMYELRIVRDAEGKPERIVGYAAVFNRDSVPMKTRAGRVIIERILPGAFAEELKSNHEVRATVLHNDDMVPIARRSKGTLKLEEDEHGLRAEILLGNTSIHRDVVGWIEHGDLDKMSFAFEDFEEVDSGPVKQDDGTYRRTIRRIIGLRDVTLADDRAAYPDTSVSLRTADEVIDRQERATVTIEVPDLQYFCQELISAKDHLMYVVTRITETTENLIAQSADFSETDRKAAAYARAVIAELMTELENCDLVISKIKPDIATLTPEEQARAIMALESAGIRQPEKLQAVARSIMRLYNLRAVKLNQAGYKYAMELAQSGRIDWGDWDASKVDRDQEHGTSFLAIETEMDEDTAGHWKFPVVAGGKVSRKALASAIAYAKKNGYDDIADAAQKIAEVCDQKKEGA